MAIKVSGTTVISDSKTLSNITRMTIPAGATGSRPGSPVTGSLFFNTSNSSGTYLEFYTGSVWKSLTSNAQVVQWLFKYLEQR